MPSPESFNGSCFFPGVGTSGEIEKDNAEIINGRLYAVHTDQLNTPRQLTDENGQKVWQWGISGFGELEPTTAQTGWVRERNGSAGQISNTLPVTFNLRFPGQQFDKETGLHYNHHRYYDPQWTVGYTEADPLGLNAGWNRFVYVDGSPLLYLDMDGRASSSPLGIGIAILGGSCSIYAYQKSLYSSYPKENDKSRHCMASCLITKCMMGLPAAPAIGVGKEIMDLIAGGKFEIEDIQANNCGVKKGYKFFWGDCEKDCENQPL